jgi:L-amino acid N-acyltransferase YncA
MTAKTMTSTTKKALSFTQAVPADSSRVAAFILTHGPNAWNWLPPAGVQAHAQDLAEGRAHAVLAWQSDELVGVVTYQCTHQFDSYQDVDRRQALHGYVCEAVVRADCAGQGLGAQLLARVQLALQAQGVREVYIDRHEENAASAGTMRKAGFVEIATYADPSRRPHGSGRTTVCRWVMPQPA